MRQEDEPMNRIYRLVRDPVNGRCTVTSELAKCHGSGTDRSAAAYAALPARLALAVALAAALPAMAVEHTTPILVNAGESLDVPSGDSMLHTGSGYAATALGQGAALTITDLDLRVTNRGSGINASTGGQVQINGGHIQLGGGTDTVFAALNATGTGSVLRADNLQIDADRNGSGFGTVNALNGGQVWLTGGRINSSGTVLQASDARSELHVSGTTLNIQSNGSVQASGGGLLDLRDLQLSFGSSGAPGGRLSVTGVGSVLALDNVAVSNGYFDVGDGALLRINGGTTSSTDGSIRLLGSSASRRYAKAEITGGRFDTTGGYGVNVNSWGTLIANGAQFTVREGYSGLWLSSVESSATLTDTRINTYGTNGYGHGVDVWGGTATVTGGSIDTYGDGVYGLRASGSNPPTAYSRIRTQGLDITTHGDGGGGVFLGGSTADVQLAGGSITTQGASSFGIVQMNTSKLTADSLRIHAQGENAGAYRSYITVFGPYWNRLTFNDSQLRSEDGPALWLQGSNHALTLNNTEVIAGRQGALDGGRLLRVSDTVFTDGSSVATSDIVFTADNSRLTGDVVVDSATANVQMNLRNATVFNGALRADSGYQVASLALDGSSQWQVRGDSSLGTLEHAGSIDFVAPSSGDFKTLTISGDYVGNGGSWVFNRQLGDDDSLGDRVLIGGNSSGNAAVSVRNAGGAGALTQEGIRLISVAGQSDAQFTLQGRAVAGAYDYFLFKGGVSTPDDGNWYLRSEYVPPVDPPEPPDPPVDPPVDPPIDPPVDPPVDPPTPPEPPIDPPLPPTPPKVQRPEPAAYLANQSAALRMFQHSLHDRSGDPGTLPSGGADATAWAYVRSSQPQNGSRDGQVGVDSQLNSVLVGVGHSFEVHPGGSLQVGLMAGQGRARSDATSQVTGYRARGVVNGTSLGLYATWLQDAAMHSGFYVDSWLQYGRFRNSVQGDGLDKERYRAHSWTGSAEAGYVLPLQRNAQRALYLEPQLQLIHSQYDADRVTEANGTVVESRRAGGTTTRIGARLYTRSLTPAQGQVQPFVAVNWWSGGNTSAIDVDGERMQRNQPRDIYETKAGVQLDLRGGWRGWGQIGYQTGGQGFHDTNAQMGVSYSW